MVKHFLRNISTTCVLFVFLMCFLAGCEKKSISFGENLAESYTNILIIDSLTPLISTVKSDSFITSGTITVMAGK